MTLSRQTHLGSIDTKLLTIVDLQGPPVWPCTIIQPEKAYILHRLPDELLLLIVKFSLYTNVYTTRETTHVRWALFEDTRAGDTSCIMALSQVCHRCKTYRPAVIVQQYRLHVSRSNDTAFDTSSQTSSYAKLQSRSASALSVGNSFYILSSDQVSLWSSS
jgi:hypothetical protein